MIKTNNIVLTIDGLAKLKKELNFLKKNKRQEIAERIRESKEYGDISENAEFDQAKDDQGFIEGKIREIEYLIKHAKIINSCQTDRVVPGCTVTIKSKSETEKYRLVGFSEAEPSKGSISTDSLLGEALIGKTKGEKVQLQAPSGRVEYLILKIE